MRDGAIAPKAGVDRDGSSVANYYERRGRIPAFAGVAIYSYGTAVLGEAGSTERVEELVMRGIDYRQPGIIDAMQAPKPKSPKVRRAFRP